ncbi:MAG: hypothetical protein ABW040_02225 [Microbacteriaceae bacterium]
MSHGAALELAALAGRARAMAAEVEQVALIVHPPDPTEWSGRASQAFAAALFPLQADVRRASLAVTEVAAAIDRTVVNTGV